MKNLDFNKTIDNTTPKLNSDISNFSETANSTFSCTRRTLEAFEYREINFVKLTK